MTTYAVVGAIVAWVLGWVWFTYLFPKVREELSGGTGGMGRVAVVAALALLVFSYAFGSFLLNRNVADFGDAMRVGFKVWVGFLLPVIAIWWASTRKSTNVLIATGGLWLVQTLALIIIATWILL